jgi:hypothetical protein
MLDDHDNHLTWRCDGCNAVAEFEGLDFHSAWTELKAKGWSATRMDDGWLHECPRCCRPKGSVLNLPLVSG